MTSYYLSDAATQLTCPNKLAALGRSENFVGWEAIDYAALSTNQKIGLTELIGLRSAQEDCLSFIESIAPELLTHTLYGLATRIALAIKEVAYRWDQDYLNGRVEDDGSTLSATIVNGDHLFTATLGDAMSYLAIYDSEGNVVGVRRLNQIFHEPELEQARLEAAGASVEMNGVNGGLSVSRSVGDSPYNYKKHEDTIIFKDVVSDTPTVELNSISSIVRSFGLNEDTVGPIKLITCCDGLIEMARAGLVKKTLADGSEDEAYLLGALRHIEDSAKLAPHILASRLAHLAINDGSKDNVSVIIQELARDTHSFQGVYDGHFGKYASLRLGKELNQALLNELTVHDNAIITSRLHALTQNGTPFEFRDNSYDTNTYASPYRPRDFTDAATSSTTTDSALSDDTSLMKQKLAHVERIQRTSRKKRPPQSFFRYSPTDAKPRMAMRLTFDDNGDEDATMDTPASSSSDTSSVGASLAGAASSRATASGVKRAVVASPHPDDLLPPDPKRVNYFNADDDDDEWQPHSWKRANYPTAGDDDDDDEDEWQPRTFEDEVDAHHNDDDAKESYLESPTRFYNR